MLGEHLGRTKAVWEAFAARVGAEFPDMSLEWRYYRDGKAWLCKLVHKKKTVCWISIWNRFFKTTFYFTGRSDRDIAALPVPSDLKASYRARKPIGALKPVTVEVRTRKALEAVFVLVKYKSSLR